MQIYNTPLLVAPSHAQAFARKIEALALTPDANRLTVPRSPGQPFRATKDGVAVIGVTAPMTNRMTPWPGLLSYEYLSVALNAAAKDTSVSSIVLDCDSPGGECIGCFELAAQIRAIDKSKPVVASVNGLCASACYALASACRSITATPSSVIGSIGVILLHVDMSRMLDRAGVGVSLIDAPEGGHKADANEFEPLPDDVKADLQRDVNVFYDQFIACVAAGRGARLSADAAKKTEAKTYIGAEAKAAGLVDAIGSFSDVLASVESSARIAAATRKLAAEAQAAERAKAAAEAAAGNYGWDSIIAAQKARNR